MHFKTDYMDIIKVCIEMHGCISRLNYTIHPDPP